MATSRSDAEYQATEERLITLSIGQVMLDGSLTIPDGASRIVVFAHGSGSSRLSPRNRFVAIVLNKGGLATLLLDLLTDEEAAIDERTGHLRFDIQLLAGRVVDVVDWLRLQTVTKDLSVGLFGASTGAAAALIAAAVRPREIGAIVSRGGRPDLAGHSLNAVCAPTLLIVGGNDEQVIELNQLALDQLRCEKQLIIVPGATHLFEEPGALEQVSILARDWFTQRFQPSR